jgi:competence protein ComEC
MFIVTNPDRDHYEGFFDALNKYRVDVFMESGLASTTPEFNLLKDKVNNKKIPVVVARRGQVIDIGGGAYIEILFPNRDVSTLASNNSSIISRLVYGDTSFIFQGDAPQAMEEYVLALGANNLNSDVIALGHHGSRTSSGPEYIQAVSPQYAVISAGKNNSYGHPHKEVVETFKGTDSMLLSTCATGRITFESDGTDLVLNNKKIVPVVVGCK